MTFSLFSTSRPVKTKTQITEDLNQKQEKEDGTTFSLQSEFGRNN